jgi:hypothetical protein
MHDYREKRLALWNTMNKSFKTCMSLQQRCIKYKQNVPGGKVNIWEVIVSAILSKKCVCTCVLFRTVSEIELFHCTDEQHAVSSHELQSALMLTVEFSKMYYTR